MASSKELESELTQLVADFLHYAPRALKIRSKDGQIVPLRLNTAQTYVHSRIEEQIKNTGKARALILKGRQQGMSTLIGARFYWLTSMRFGKQASILTHLQDSTDALFDMTRRYHELCPVEMKQPTSAASAKELRFSELDSGYNVATAGSRATGRGRTIQYFHGSEVAFWQNAEDHLAGIGQAVPDLPGTEVYLESTANGVGNLFHQMWIEAEKGKSEYIPIFVPWHWQAEYRKVPPSDFKLDDDERIYSQLHQLDDGQMCWRRAKIAGDFRNDAALFCQEYPATSAEAFRRVHGNPLIDPDHVAIARKAAVDPGSAPLVMGLDPAEYGSDDTALVLRRGRKIEKIIRWNGKGTMETVGLAAKIYDEWQPVCVNVDCTGVGSGVADRLAELGYQVNRIHFGERAIESAQYINRRAEMWGLMRYWLADAPCSVPDDDVLESELCAPQYTYDSSRRLKLESKEEMRKRGVSSPDSGDALALTFAVPVYAPIEGTKPRSWREKERANWRV